MADTSLLTPPPSPTKEDDEAAGDRLTNCSLAARLHSHVNRTTRSVTSDPLTPPNTPPRQRASPRRAVTLAGLYQIDGNDEQKPVSGRDWPCNTDNFPFTPLLAHSAPRDHFRNYPTIDLTSPKAHAFPSPPLSSPESLTPLTHAAPAVHAFPFPPQRRRSSALSPLSLRMARPQSLPGQRSPNTIATRGRRYSGTLDRFIPERPSDELTNQSFRLSRPPDRLSIHERVRRQRPPGHDPFARSARDTYQQIVPQLSAPFNDVRHSSLSASILPIASPRRRRTRTIETNTQSNVWGVGTAGGRLPSATSVLDGHGGHLSSGTNAPLFSAPFLSKPDRSKDLDLYERRLAIAFDIDQSSRVLKMADVPTSPTRPSSHPTSPHSPTAQVVGGVNGEVSWKDGKWSQDGLTKVLDAPSLRDDYYCSLLAYSVTGNCLAVGLGHQVYLWSESRGVHTSADLNIYATAHVTALSFSSTPGHKAILAVGRADGRVVLWGLLDHEARFDTKQPDPVSCVCFRQQPVKRASKRDPHIMMDVEELLVGDESGHVYYYSVEWPEAEAQALFNWSGALTLLGRITIHSQQVCGLSWSVEGDLFASGGNDNLCALFDTKKTLLTQTLNEVLSSSMDNDPHARQTWTVIPGVGRTLAIPASRSKHRWILNAAVKAIAFCPWQRGLVAIGGGSNDRCIHFYHTISGARLASIDCFAQVTSLIWSRTRREICATFGFAQPEHPYRIAVFAWPSCERLIAIPWHDEHRALYAIPYPGGPSAGRKEGEGGRWWQRTADEGCIVVATSDASIKFHEVWSERRRSPGGHRGLLGGSDILESLHSVDQRGNEGIR